MELSSRAPSKWMQRFFISRVHAVVIIRVVTERLCRTHISAESLHGKRRGKRAAHRRKKEKDLERTGEVQKGWRDTV